MKQDELDELLNTLKRWKAEDRKIVLWLELPGRASLTVNRPGSASIEDVPDSADGEVAFRFGGARRMESYPFPCRTKSSRTESKSRTNLRPFGESVKIMRRVLSLLGE